ncbi:GerAB/ArcD/ProY family transporter [Paenibacillus cymbidii]|uniref:GerAB/ArcD/ProY family transporter n=1 Tax=Paenibacillus cymbidii TaxID=1639034 RepID=UPI001081FE96|nr:endospore germination permease [Paenibacillus cymbidii]
MKAFGLNEITRMQFILLNAGIQISIGFLTLPQALAAKAGTDGWIALLAGWAVAVLASVVLVRLMKRRPEGTLPDLLAAYAGAWAGKASALVIALYFLYFSYACLVTTVLTLQVWLLSSTHAYVIMFLLLVPSYMIVRGGLHIVGRYAEMAFALSIWVFIFYLQPLKNAHWLYLLPVLKEGWSPVMGAVATTFYYFIGFATSFVFFPFLSNKRGAEWCVVASNTIAMLAFLFIVIVCFVYFSPDKFTDYDKPPITILKTLEMKYVDRIEVLFIAIYMFIFSLSWIPSTYAAVFCIGYLFGKRNHRPFLLAAYALVLAATFVYMPTAKESEQLNNWLGKAGFYVEYVAPASLLAIVWLRDRIAASRSA